MANKTAMTDADVVAFLEGVEPPRRREEGLALDRLFREATDWAPRMWGPSIVGYGQYSYTYSSGRSGDWLATGFSPRKAKLSIYIMPGYQDYSDILAGLGKHRLGRSCLYVTKLADIDMAVLARLVQAGIRDLGRHYPVAPT